MPRRRSRPILDTVRAQLHARRGDWPFLCSVANVPYSTLTKIAEGSTENPRIKTVQALLDAFERLPLSGRPGATR